MTDYSVRTYTADEIPADIIDELDLNTNNIEYCTVFDSLEDFAIYEVEDGWYSTLELNHDYHGAPNLLEYINYKALGAALSQTCDESCNFVLSDGRVVAFC
jgi:hypothetical protein